MSYRDPRQLLEHILHEISHVTESEPKRGSGEWIECRCPAHDDQTASLGVKAGTRCILLKCHAGCSYESITAALGMTAHDLFYDDDSARPSGRSTSARRRQITVELLAVDKGLPTRWLRELGVNEITEGKHAGNVRITYRLLDGTPALRQRIRRTLKASARIKIGTGKDGKDRTIPGSSWEGARDGPAPVPYGLWREDNRLDDDRPLCIVEGESDCWTLWFHGFKALGIPGASMLKTLELEHVAGATEIVVVAEADKAGARFPKTLKSRLDELEWDGNLRIIEMTPDAKDPNALYQRGVDDFMLAWHRLLAAAELFEPTAPAPPEGEAAPASDDHARYRHRSDCEPQEVATLFLADALPESPSRSTSQGLVYYRDHFYRWTGQAYALWPEGELKATLVEFIRRTGYGKPATNFVGNVLLNLTGIGRVPHHIEPPFWISKERPAGDHLVLRNGILPIDKLVRGGLRQDVLMPHTPDLFTLNPLDFAFDAEARCPKWSEFLERVVPEDENRALLAEWFGYCLLPTQCYQRIMLLQGAGANGKSVVMAVLRDLVGARNCSSQNVDSLHEQFALEPLVGKLVNFSNEFAHIEPAGESRLKQISGGDDVTINPKGREQYQAKLFCRFVISSNNPPRITDRSDGMWRRLVVLPFPVRIPVAEQRPFDELVGELRVELPGVLVWALIGLATLRGRRYFAENEATRSAKEQYKRNSNPARAFLGEFVSITDHDSWEPVAKVYEGYRKYCKASGHSRPLALPQFGIEVAAWRREAEPGIPEDVLRPRRRRDAQGNRFACYEGITLANGLDDYCLSGAGTALSRDALDT